MPQAVTMSKNILVVDDNHINRMFLEVSLNEAGHYVVLAFDGYQAIKYAHRQSFDIVFMDVRMHGMNGIEAASQIKQIQNTPIIGVSAEPINDPNLIFTDTMLKPLQIKEVLSCIKLHSSKNLFNEKKALAAARDDHQIMMQLQNMFIEQLPKQIAQANTLIEKQQVEQLDSHLHQLLGSAKLCAADQLVTLLETYKKQISYKNNRLSTKDILWKQIEKIISRMCR